MHPFCHRRVTKDGRPLLRFIFYFCRPSFIPHHFPQPMNCTGVPGA